MENYHRFARGYLTYRNELPQGSICSATTREALIDRATRQVRQSCPDHPVFDLPSAVIRDEVQWIGQHGLTDTSDYQSASLHGSLDVEDEWLGVIFTIYTKYLSLRQQAGYRYDWDDIAVEVKNQLLADTSERRYCHVVIDEGQDFSPEMLRSLAAAISGEGSLTFFGDIAQQIYGRRISWRSAGLKIGKVWEFRENYRNTLQIARYGLAIMQMPWFNRIREELVEPVSPKADGPKPLIVKCTNEAAEIDFVIEQAVLLAKSQSVAVLLRSHRAQKRLSDRLPKGAVQLTKSMGSWSAFTKMHYGTFHAAKGLEFDSVLIPFCNSTELPDSDHVESYGLDEAKSRDGSLLYVGAMRAKQRLIISHNGELTSLLPCDSSLCDLQKI